MKNKEMFRLLRLPDEYESIFDAIEILFLFLDELRENSFVDERPRTVLISQKIKKLIQLLCIFCEIEVDRAMIEVD